MALAWKAGWVNALGGSNPPTSAAGSQTRERRPESLGPAFCIYGPGGEPGTDADRSVPESRTRSTTGGAAHTTPASNSPPVTAATVLGPRGRPYGAPRPKTAAVTCRPTHRWVASSSAPV